MTLLGIAAGCRLHQLLGASFWFDEACAWKISRFAGWDLLDAVTRDAHPPLFYLLQKAWQNLFGVSVLAARSLSVICGMMTVLAVAGLSLQIARIRLPGSLRLAHFYLPLLAATIVSFSSLQIELSQQARPYQLGACLSLLAASCLWSALQTPETVWKWGGFCIAGILLSYTHYFCLFMLTALFVFGSGEVILSWMRADDTPRCLKSRRQLSGLVFSAGIMQLSWWPWLATFQQQCERANAQLWMPSLTWNEWERIGAQTLAGSSASFPALGWLTTGIWVAIPVLLLVSCGGEGRLIACCTAIPLLLAVSYSLLIRNILEPRYLVFAQVMLLIGAALLIHAIRMPLLRAGAVVLVMCWLLFWCGKYATQRNWHATHAGLLQVVDYLDQVRHADEPVIVCSPFLFVSIQSLLREPANVFVNYAGDHRQDLLAGPPLQLSDYVPVSPMLRDRPQRLWTVDAERLFGRTEAVSIPVEYQPAGQVRFAESSGIPAELIVRGYECPETDQGAAGLSTRPR